MFSFLMIPFLSEGFFCFIFFGFYDIMEIEKGSDDPFKGIETFILVSVVITDKTLFSLRLEGVRIRLFLGPNMSHYSSI